MRFSAFTAATLAATRESWCKDVVQSGGFLPDVEQQLDWAEKHIVLTDTEVAYGIFNDDGDDAVGICELCITRQSVRSKWVKFMRLRLRPSIDEQLFAHKKEGVTAALEAYITCVGGVFDLKNQHKASIIKVYGRTQQQIAFLTLLSAALEKRDKITFESSIEGRWLVLNWKNHE